MIKIKKHPAFFVVGSTIAPISAILMLPFLWQKLTPEDYGLLATAELIMAFGTAFIGLQQESSLNRLYFDWKECEKNKNISTLVTLNLAATIFFGLVLLFLFKYFGRIFLPEEVLNNFDLIFLFLIYSIIAKQRGIFNAYVRVTGQSLEFFLYSLIATLIQIAFVVQFVFIENLKLSGYILALLFTESLVAISVILFMYKQTGFYFIISTARSSLKFSVPLIPASIFSSSSTIVERSLLLTYVPLSDMGIYAVCQKVASIIQLANNSLKMLFAPKLFSMVSDSAELANINGYREKYFSIIIFVAILISPAMYILTALTPVDDYKKAVDYFPYFVIAGVVASAFPYYCSGTFMGKKTNQIFYPHLLELVSFTIMAIIFGTLYSLDGLVIAKLLATIIMFSIGFLISQKAYYLPIKMKVRTKLIIALFVLLQSLYLSSNRYWL